MGKGEFKFSSSGTILKGKFVNGKLEGEGKEVGDVAGEGGEQQEESDWEDSASKWGEQEVLVSDWIAEGEEGLCWSTARESTSI